MDVIYERIINLKIYKRKPALCGQMSECVCPQSSSAALESHHLTFFSSFLLFSFVSVLILVFFFFKYFLWARIIYSQPLQTCKRISSHLMHITHFFGLLYSISKCPPFYSSLQKERKGSSNEIISQ